MTTEGWIILKSATERRYSMNYIFSPVRMKNIALWNMQKPLYIDVHHQKYRLMANRFGMKKN